MTLGIRKLIVLVLVVALFLVANLIFVTNWLAEKGVIDWAQDIRREYLTGTAITIIVVLLILLVAPRGQGRGLFRRCPRRVRNHRPVRLGHGGSAARPAADGPDFRLYVQQRHPEHPHRETHGLGQRRRNQLQRDHAPVQQLIERRVHA